MIIFDGDTTAHHREDQLSKQLQNLGVVSTQTPPQIAAILFAEDSASQLYTQLKREAAQRVGIAYQTFIFSLRDGVDEVAEVITQLNLDPSITGIIIQKPRRMTWAKTKGIAQDKGRKTIRQAFNSWWRFLCSRIAVEKDVDGLHPTTLQAIEDGTWKEQGRVLPATASAVLEILDQGLEATALSHDQVQVAVLGQSDIVGLPVFYELQNRDIQVRLLTRDDLKQRLLSGKNLTDFNVIISATGQHHLITGSMIAPGSLLIDVGEPRADIDRSSVEDKAAFLTPVPGGVGPMTVVHLLGNCLVLYQQQL